MRYYSEYADELFRSLEWIEADISDIPAMEAAFVNVEQVYHAAALISFAPQDQDRMMKVNAKGTANVVNLCLAQKIKKLCYVSSIATIGTGRSEEQANEEDAYQDQYANDYGRSKYEAELRYGADQLKDFQLSSSIPGLFWAPDFGAVHLAAYL